VQRLRTPDERFTNLPGFPFNPRYAAALDPTRGEPLRMAYLDEGGAEDDVVLLLHGEPSWSYLYRSMVPILVARGHRVVAPDLIGFGRSAKLSGREDPAHDANVTAWKVLKRWTKSFLCCYSDGDPITRGAERKFLEMVPGTKGQAHVTIEGGGHFLQEEKGVERPGVLNDFIARN
jgi:pimeloyl-ACP methyl ester carboxylesterase